MQCFLRTFFGLEKSSLKPKEKTGPVLRNRKGRMCKWWSSMMGILLGRKRYKVVLCLSRHTCIFLEDPGLKIQVQSRLRGVLSLKQPKEKETKFSQKDESTSTGGEKEQLAQNRREKAEQHIPCPSSFSRIHVWEQLYRLKITDFAFRDFQLNTRHLRAHNRRL